MLEPGVNQHERYGAGRGRHTSPNDPLADWCIRSRLRPYTGIQSPADANSQTSGHRNDNQEDEHLDCGPLLAAHPGPAPAARLLALQLLLPHLQLIASWPRRVDIRCAAFLLQQIRLALARLSLLLSQGLCLEILVKRRVADVDVLFRFRGVRLMVVRRGGRSRELFVMG